MSNYNEQMADQYQQQYAAPAIYSPVDVRNKFLAKVYMTFGAGLIAATFACLVTMMSQPLLSIAASIITTWWLYLLLVFGMAFGVQAVSRIPVVNVFAYGIYTLFFGMLTAPIILGVMGPNGDATPVLQALGLTVLLYAGLSIWSLTTKEDLSGWGTYLFIGALLLIGVGVIGMVTGYGLGLWYSAIWVALLAGFTMYDTQMIQRHYPVDMWIVGAVQMFTNFILLFWHIMMLVAGSRR